MLLWIWGGAAALFVLVISTGFLEARDHALRELEVAANYQAGVHAGRIAEAFHSAASATDALTGSILRNAGDLERLRELMDRLLVVRPEVVSVRLSFTASPFRPDHAPRTIVRDGEEEQLLPFTGEAPEDRVWTLPERQNGQLVTSYHRPMFGPDGTLMASLAVQISLEEATRDVARLAREGAAYGFLFDRDGRLVAFPDSGQLLSPVNTLSAELGPTQLGSQDPLFVQAVDPLLRRPSWIVLHPIGRTGLGLGIVYLVQSEMLELYRLELRGLVLAAAGLTGLFLLVAVLSNSIARPISELARATRSVTESGFDLRLDPPEGSTQEVVELTSAFNTMLDELRQRAEQLGQASRERERIESELDIAARIQSSFLPSCVPLGERFSLHATSRPAREVGGDFYDFFKVDEQRLGFCLGDVSGKGVPAALYMAACRTLLHSVASTGAAPDVTLSRVNRNLSELLEAGTFVTLFYGLLDLSSGEVIYANAGHHLPLLSTGGGIHELSPCEGLPLGIMPEAEYSCGRITLAPGEGLFLFSDGVTEAMNDKGELFETERLVKTLEGVANASAEERLDTVVAAVAAFVDGAPRSDDLSALAIDYLGG